jgi:D-alanyl-D-alanine endopeptidase (penicillin-binding protein 7)
MDAVLNWLWQGAVVAGAASLMLVALRRAHANLRYVVCWVAALVVVGLPVLPSLRAAAPVAIISMPHTDALVALPDAWWTSANVILAVALMWACVHIVRFVASIAAVRRIRLASEPFPADLEAALPHWCEVRDRGRRATLVVSDAVGSAAVLGWGRPVIAVAPSLVRTLEPDDLDRVLIHEWAHVQRRDDLANIFQIAVRVAGGWHPALWWIERRLHIEREMACDETAVATTGSPKRYAGCLMKLSSLAAAPRGLQTATAIFSRPGLSARVARIVSRDRPMARGWARAMAVAVVVALCVLSSAVGDVTLVETTIFAEALPAVAALAPSIPHARVVTVAPLAVPSDEAVADVSAAVPVRSARSQPPVQAEQVSALPQPRAEEIVALDSREPESVRALDVLGADHARETEPGAVPPPAIDPARAQPSPDSSATAADGRSPWSAAAAGGIVIGRTSKDAGVATAGFFSKFARHVASSF